MADRLTKNSFERGLNTDVSKAKLEPNFYTEAYNLDTVADGDFFALKNIAGTTKVKDIINVADTTVLGVFNNNYIIGGLIKKCLTIFTATDGGGDFKIWCYDTENGDLYEVFEETTPTGYITTSRVMDAVGYAENNIDHLYFTDDFNEIRFLRCEIPSPYVPNFLTENDLSLQRKGANGKVVLDSVLTGGSLLSGSYQYAYRMVDPVNKKFTKWSSLTPPIHVYSAANSTTVAVYSDYGLPTEFKIRIDILPTNEELTNWSYYQLAVVENIYPTGPETVVEGENQTFVASLLPIRSNDYPIQTNTYDHKTNEKIGVIPIEDLVVDLAAIKNVKTLNVKGKRLVLANVDYHNLEFDNGDPVAGGSILTRTSTVGDIFSSHEESIFRGHFRDEVYRYGIVYKDKWGNRSPAKVLDLNAITNNQISGTLPDVRFPSRSTSNAWTIFDTNTGPSRLRTLGLALTNIHNHPTWAVGFEIVRAKRIKKIISQTPVIPMTFVRGIGALGGYPSAAVTDNNGGSADTEYPDAQPQTPSEIYKPKNLFWPDPRIIKKVGASSGTGGNAVQRGEAELQRSTLNVPLAMIFPQNFMYENIFELDGSEKLQTVDYCAMKAAITDSSVGTAGDTLETIIKGTFYALGKDDYYFDPAWSAKSISDEHKIKAHLTFQNLATANSLSGKRVMDYNDLLTEGVDYGFAPNIQKCIIVDAPTAVHDIMSGSRTFAGAGNMTGVSGGTAIFSSTPTLVYESDITNKYINEYSNYSNKSSYVQAIKIVNIVNNAGDDRYGDVDTQHEFISTGASYFFTTSELVDVQAGTQVDVDLDVWGGDCFVAPHTFKVADGDYSVVNQGKHNGAFDDFGPLHTKWGKYFINTYGAAIALPIGIESAAQFITVVLESEYNGGVMAQDVFVDNGAVNNMPIPMPPGKENNRSPLTYRYNINLSKQNDEKVYFTKPEFNFVRSSFPARVLFSDQKIYNTDIQGFDVFRVLNFLDLEEKNGEITKLALEHDNLYAIQERGVVGLPVGETQLTTTDAGQLAVGTADFFGRPIVIDTARGSQHLKTVVETGSGVYLADNINKAVYLLVGNVLNNISKINNETLFRSLLGGPLSGNDLFGVYDPYRKQYWLGSSSFCHVFNEDKKQWVGAFEFPTGTLKTGIATNFELYLIGTVGNLSSIYIMYNGTAGDLFGTSTTPRVSFVVNPDDAIAKKFLNQLYVASDRLATADFQVDREVSSTDQSILGTIIDVSPKGGNYRIKLPRVAATKERLRGQRLLVTVKWKTGNPVVSLSEILTKYQLESRVPF